MRGNIFSVLCFLMSLSALVMSFKNRLFKIGIVDTHLVLSLCSKDLAKQKHTSKDVKQEVDRIRKVLLAFSQENKIFLFAKGAVFKHDVVDYTNDILSWLNKGAL